MALERPYANYKVFFFFEKVNVILFTNGSLVFRNVTDTVFRYFVKRFLVENL